jgi:hypothetical protein
VLQIADGTEVEIKLPDRLKVAADRRAIKAVPSVLDVRLM